MCPASKAADSWLDGWCYRKMSINYLWNNMTLLWSIAVSYPWNIFLPSSLVNCCELLVNVIQIRTCILEITFTNNCWCLSCEIQTNWSFMGDLSSLFVAWLCTDNLIILCIQVIDQERLLTSILLFLLNVSIPLGWVLEKLYLYLAPYWLFPLYKRLLQLCSSVFCALTTGWCHGFLSKP